MTTKAILNVCLLLLISMFSLVSCSVKDNGGEIQELDKKYLSESQLFALHQAIDNDPENSENYYRRAKVYFEREDQSKALKDIEQAIKLNNTEGKYYLLQAKILEISKNLPSALAAAKTAESLKVNSAEIKILLSLLYLEMNQLGKAQEYLTQASQLTPHHPDVFFLKGKYAAIQGDTSLALANFFTTITNDTINTEAYKELSKIYFIKHNYDSAMMFVTTGRAIDPEDPFFYYIEGKFLEHLAMKESSKNSYLSSLKFDSTYSEAYQALAMMYERDNNLDAAATYFEKELQYNPNSLGSTIRLAEIYEKQNRAQLSVPLFERVLLIDTANGKAKAELQRLYVLYPKKKEPEPRQDTVSSVKKTETPISKPVTPDTIKKTVPKPFVKPDTASKKTFPKPIKPDTVSRPSPDDVKNNKRKRSDSTKEIRKFAPVIKNPDSTKIETKKDTVKK